MITKKTDRGVNRNSKWLVVATFLSVVVLIKIIIILSEYNLASREETLMNQVKISQPVILRQTQAREDSLLTSYEMVDSAEAIYRIPISRAMELIAAEGDN